MRIRGADVIIRTLIDEGVKTVFGYPGGAVIDIYDALYDYKDQIRHIRTSHEQGATHAADGFARSTGETGVVIATSGPGATNTVTGIATAYMDSIPMVVITGNASRNLIGKDSFQEIDIIGITMPITKHNFVIRDVKYLQDTIRRAFMIASSGRKGPVVVDVPKDIMSELTEYEPKGKLKYEKNYESATEEEIKKVAECINKSKKPILYCGGGVTASGAFRELRELIHKNSIPACNTIMGIGVLGYEDDLNLGMLGMHGRVSSNFAIAECDLLIACGVRFSDRVALNTKKFAKNATIIHMDIDKSEIDKNVIADYGVVGDIKDTLTKLCPHVKEQKREDWINEIKELRKEDYVPQESRELIKPHSVIQHISKRLGEDMIFVTDVGQHQMWTAQYSGRTKPRSFLTSGGLGTMGYGYGAAMGAKLGNPDRHVVHITGDGSFNMNFNEILTSVNNDIKIITVVMDNSALGMVRQWQHLLYNDRYSATDVKQTTDYVKLAEALGAIGYNCETFEEFTKAFEEAIVAPKSVVIKVGIDSDERVFPMIPAGGTVDDIIVE
ncbi:MAG: biosynthetic-type acetolactate synthase large subunit [Peptoniphilus sp.]|nr:biosynthetic-type acetolactate synthase large subunit [Peptoniphilus sp.]